MGKRKSPEKYYLKNWKNKENPIEDIGELIKKIEKYIDTTKAAIEKQEIRVSHLKQVQAKFIEQEQKQKQEQEQEQEQEQFTT